MLVPSGAVELDLLIRDGRICREDAPPARGRVGVGGGRIAIVAASAAGLDAKEVIDAQDRLVTPGMTDPHVHIGHGAPHAGEFWTEGSSDVIGGVTTMLTSYRRHPFNYLDLVPALIAGGEANSPIDFSIPLPLFTRQTLEELLESRRFTTPAGGASGEQSLRRRSGRAAGRRRVPAGQRVARAASPALDERARQ